MKTLDEMVKMNIAMIIATSFAESMNKGCDFPDGMLDRVKRLYEVIKDLVDNDTSLYSDEEVVIAILTMAEEFVNIHHVEQNKKHLH